MTSPALIQVDLDALEPIRPVVANFNTPVKLMTGRLLLHGWSFGYNSSTDDVVAVWDGDDTSGTMVANIVLGPTASSTVSMGWPGILIENSLYVYIGKPQTMGALWVSRPPQ